VEVFVHVISLSPGWFEGKDGRHVWWTAFFGHC
jgi:hypothetical protein